MLKRWKYSAFTSNTLIFKLKSQKKKPFKDRTVIEIESTFDSTNRPCLIFRDFSFRVGVQGMGEGKQLSHPVYTYSMLASLTSKRKRPPPPITSPTPTPALVYENRNTWGRRRLLTYWTSHYGLGFARRLRCVCSQSVSVELARGGQWDWWDSEVIHILSFLMVFDVLHFHRRAYRFHSFLKAQPISAENTVSSCR